MRIVLTVGALVVVLLGASMQAPLAQSQQSAPPMVSSAETYFVRAYFKTPFNGGLTPGYTVPVEIAIQPSILTVRPSGDQTLRGYRTWFPHPVAESDICISVDAPCEPRGDWAAVDATAESSRVVPFDVDWLGERTLWFGARFRDAAGEAILAGDGPRAPVEVYQSQASVKAVLAEDASLDNLPPAVQAVATAQRGAYPVHGAVQIEGGASMIGGLAGSSRDVRVSFSASSPAGEVTEMRVRRGGCVDEAAFDSAPWEPFAPEQTYSVFLMSNIVGYYVSVQYRDAHGQLSRVYCDDISVEGMPARP